ncbi:MAG: ribosomal-processing cysteine protease Prp [Lachnospirales bacterium]
MVKAKIFRNKNKCIYGFQIINHCDTSICAAISLLSLNIVNAIETFTEDKFSLEYDENGGFLKIEVENLKQGIDAEKSELLLNTLVLALKELSNTYEKELLLIDKVVN